MTIEERTQALKDALDEATTYERWWALQFGRGLTPEFVDRKGRQWLVVRELLEAELKRMVRKLLVDP